MCVLSRVETVHVRYDGLLTFDQIVSLGIISQYSGNALFSYYQDLVYEGAGITDQNQKLPVSHPAINDSPMPTD